MTAGSKCSVCGEILVAPEEIASLGHVDENDDELCDRCGFDMSIPEFTITVTGGTIEGAIGSTVIVEENGSVTVVASEAPEGKEFKGWSIDGGRNNNQRRSGLYVYRKRRYGPDRSLCRQTERRQARRRDNSENPEGFSGGCGLRVSSSAPYSVRFSLLTQYALSSTRRRSSKARSLRKFIRS